MYTFPFERLEAWKAARRVVADIYCISNKFPSEERYGFVQQIRRAGLSVASNLSEGCSRFSVKDQSHFFSIAYASLMEALNQLIIAKDLGWITDEDYEKVRSSIEPTSGLIAALRKSILAKGLKQ
jgi:four helix bundle protein